MDRQIPQIGNRLKRLGRRQSWLANAAGLRPGHLSKLLSGKLDARVSTLEKIADVLGARFVLVPHDMLDEVARIVGREAPARRDVGTAFDDLFIAVEREPEADDDADTSRHVDAATRDGIAQGEPEASGPKDRS